MLFLSTSLFSESVVKLSGTVTKTGGGPLRDVTVTLKNEPGISAKTGNDGRFLLESDVTPVFRETAPEASPVKFNIKSTGLSVSLASTGGGTIMIFAANGKRTFSESFTGSETSQIITLNSFVPGFSIVNINVNGKTYACSVLRVGNSLHFKNGSSNSARGEKHTIAKRSETVDTLIATKSGYREKKVPVSVYIDSNLTVTMDSAGVCTPPGPGTSKSNPIFTDVYTADPACMVDNCTFYIACGHDQGTRGFDLREWYLLKSTDMVNWTRTTPMKLNTFSWTNANAWAGHMIKGLNGKYYWYVPINDIVYSSDRMAIGVAVADSPEGPWSDALGKPLINDALEMSTWNITNIDQTPHTIDPAVFIDDDGQAYLVYGGFWTMVTVKLNSDMISLGGALKKNTPPSFFEAPYLIKRNGTYYLIYAHGAANPTKIGYATSNSPMGPWNYRGIILDQMPKAAGQDEPTNHAGVAEFAGQWYIVYHISNGPNGGGTYKRMVCIDKMEFNSDGTIKKVTPSSALTF